MKNNNSSKFTDFFIIFTVLCPCFFGYLGLNLGQMIYLSLESFFIIFLLLANWQKLLSKISTASFVIGIFFLLLCIEYNISSIININRNNYNAGDFIEILRPIVYLFFFFSSLLILKPLVKIRGAFYIFDLVEKTIFIFSFVEWIKFLHFSYPFFALYTPFSYGSINYIRLSGTTGFAYSYAWLLCICLFWSVMKNKQITFKFLYYSILVLLTGSRTGFVALFITYFIIFYNFRKTRFIMLLSLIFISTVLAILYFMEVEFVKLPIDYIIRLSLALLGKTGDGSLTTRTHQNQIAMQYFDESMFFGIASNKANNITIENFYFHHIRNWGIFGISIYLIILFLFFVFSGKYRKLVFTILVSAFIICFSSPIFDQIRNFNIMYILFAAILLEQNKGDKS